MGCPASPLDALHFAPTPQPPTHPPRYPRPLPPGMDFYVVLERPGYRVSRRRKQAGDAPRGRGACSGAAGILAAQHRALLAPFAAHLGPRGRGQPGGGSLHRSLSLLPTHSAPRPAPLCLGPPAAGQGGRAAPRDQGGRHPLVPVQGGAGRLHAGPAPAARTSAFWAAGRWCPRLGRQQELRELRRPQRALVPPPSIPLPTRAACPAQPEAGWPPAPLVWSSS